MKRILNITYTIVLMVLLSYQLFATNWYVYKNASGSNNGTSWTNAWKSFSNINWSSIQPGDYIYISGGTDSLVYSGSLSPNKSGTKANRIRIWAGKYSPNPSGHSGRVIIEGDSYNIHIQNASYLWVKGLELRNANSHAVNIEDNSTGIIIDSLNIYQFNTGGGDGYGIRLTALADSTVIQYCTIKDRIDGVGQSDVIQINYWNEYKPTRTIIHDNFLQCRSQDPMAHNDVLQSVACDGFIIYNNILISDSVGSGAEGGGMPFILSSINWGDDNPVIIFNNFAYMGGLWYPNANYGNTFYARHDDGGNSGNQPSKVFVFNNAFISNGPRNSVFAQEYLVHFASNNIFASYCPSGNDPQGRSWRDNSAHGWHSVFGGSTAYGNYLRMDSARYNLVWKQDSVQSGLFAGEFIKPGGGTQSFSNWSQWVAAGGTGLNRDPLFVSNFGHEPDQSLLRPDLKPNSPAIDAGEDLTYLYNYFKNTLGYDLPEMLSDFYGNPRGADGNWDIGAVEYQTGAVDSLPNAFAFTDITNATRSTLYTSNAVTLAGFDSAYAYAGGAEYTVYNIGDIPPYTYITGYTKVFPDDIIRVKQTSSSSYSTATNVILTVGGRSDTYTITTKAQPSQGSGGNILKVNGSILRDSTGKVIKTQ